ncbi:hypothetical protein TYRP_021854 [Tyrophagus putrescentiae]|nr:hypothetical protein TYRP_021854 [Tyrophagus putrescentiae]
MAYSSTVISSNVKNSDTEKCSNSHSVGKTMTMTRNIVTVLFVSLSVVVGLIFTLLLLFAYRQALPALPISLSIALVVLAVMSLSSEQFSQELNTQLVISENKA